MPQFWDAFNDDVPVVRTPGDRGPVPDATERFDRAVGAMMEEAGMFWAPDYRAPD